MPGIPAAMSLNIYRNGPKNLTRGDMHWYRDIIVFHMTPLAFINLPWDLWASIGFNNLECMCVFQTAWTLIYGDIHKDSYKPVLHKDSFYPVLTRWLSRGSRTPGRSARPVQSHSSVGCTLSTLRYSVHCTVYNVHFTVYSVHCTVYSAQYRTVQC